MLKLSETSTLLSSTSSELTGIKDVMIVLNNYNMPTNLIVGDLSPTSYTGPTTLNNSTLIPSNVRFIQIEMVGGGGGGGNGYKTNIPNNCGGGGGGGAYIKFNIDTSSINVTNPKSIECTIGVGGGISDGDEKINGSDTTISIYNMNNDSDNPSIVLTASGGKGGGVGSKPYGGNGGNGGIATISGSDSTIIKDEILIVNGGCGSNSFTTIGGTAYGAGGNGGDSFFGGGGCGSSLQAGNYYIPWGNDGIKQSTGVPLIAWGAGGGGGSNWNINKKALNVNGMQYGQPGQSGVIIISYSTYY
jgi:hypothetical protein